MIKKDIEILKSVGTPAIESLFQFAPGFKASIIDDAFWDRLNSVLFDNGKTADFLVALNVSKLDYAVDKLKELRKEYISHLAFEYCNGGTNPTIERLLKTGYKLFIDEISFQQSLKHAVTLSELQYLKKNLSIHDARTAFEIGDTEINSAFELLQKKNEHDAIKGKMLEWDTNEAVSENPSKLIPFSNLSEVYENREIRAAAASSSSFIRYAAAACLIGVMVWIGVKFYRQPKENEVVAKATDTIKTLAPKPASPEFAEINSSKVTVPLVKETGIGFANLQESAKVNIQIENLAPRMQSIEQYLSSTASDINQASYRVKAARELDSLKKLATSYTFDGTSLYLFNSLDTQNENRVVETADRQFFLTDGSNFYFIKHTPAPLKLIKVTDRALKERLERIIFDMK